LCWLCLVVPSLSYPSFPSIGLKGEGKVVASLIISFLPVVTSEIYIYIQPLNIYILFWSNQSIEKFEKLFREEKTEL
jgi:hypothetical protein